MIMMEQTNDFLLQTRRDFLQLRDAGNLVQWADPAKTATAETTVLRATLNRYELIAIGVEESTLDERVYREYHRTTLVRDWIAFKPFIIRRRENTHTPTYYCKFEALAKKWAKASELDQC